MTIRVYIANAEVPLLAAHFAGYGLDCTIQTGTGVWRGQVEPTTITTFGGASSADVVAKIREATRRWLLAHQELSAYVEEVPEIEGELWTAA